MSEIMTMYHKNERLKKIAVILVTGLTTMVVLDYFSISVNVFSAGTDGVARIISSLLYEWFHIKINTGAFIFLLDIPVFVLEFLKVGKRATTLSFVNVVCMSVMTMLFPVGQITDNILVSAPVGGALLGPGIGLSLKMGFTTGGADTISLVLSQTTGKIVGNYMLILNGIIVVITDSFFNWKSTLYTVISIYVMAQVIDAIHTSHQKIIAMIVIVKPEGITGELAKRMVHGMTLLLFVGGYPRKQGNMIMMVIIRCEVHDFDQIVHEIDDNAFINILPTHSVFSRFINEDEQKMYRTAGVSPEIKNRSQKK